MRITIAKLSISLILFSLVGWNCSWAVKDVKKSEPELRIQWPEGTIVYKRSQLLSRPDVRTLEVDDDPAYRPNSASAHSKTETKTEKAETEKKMKYRAVPIAALFSKVEVPRDATVQFQCLDGFSAPISRDLLLNQSPTGAIAYLAIEAEGEPWPVLDPLHNLKTPGPFYLIWENAKKSGIGREEWPYQLSGFEVKKSLRSIYPAIFPDDNLSQKDPISRGFRSFTKNCFTCHTLNLQGQAQMGPDLNFPMSPTEYLNRNFIKNIVRNPQKVRAWPAGKMKGFSATEISDDELNDIIAYLTHMSQRKIKASF